ncbi:uncharacterized protein LOC110668706 [Hevea brasiliensis]|uniref:uncharacterized protein LOC110668706 n=1 Tax=Hevea brasiliensis TaxID=3981 RepID=UPI0025E6FA5A|nr:uncharacterized protein LOC110668706 [Hevea brasiliensis]
MALPTALRRATASGFFSKLIKPHDQGLELLTGFTFLLWHIWKNRNLLSFQHQSCPFSEVISKALNHHDDFYESQQQQSASQRIVVPVATHILPLPSEYIKINFDAAVNGQGNYGAVAALARDHRNQPCRWVCRRYLAITDPLTLESLAFREALLLAKAKGFEKVIIEGDCQVVIRLLNGESILTPLEIHDILNDVKMLSADCFEISFCYVNQSCNQAAHCLAAITLRDDTFLYNPWQQIIIVTSLLATLGLQ